MALMDNPAIIPSTGTRQFGILLKKNVLIKLRRPKAACIELAMPIVLFALLAYTRSVYVVEVNGPYYFRHEPIYPLSRLLTGAYPASQAATEVGAEDVYTDTDQDGGGGGSDGNSMYDDLVAELYCSTDIDSMGVEVINGVLGWNMDGETVEDWLRTADASEEAGKVRDFITGWQECDTADIVNRIDETRMVYLDSDLPQRMEDAARLLDHEIRAINSELDNEAAFRLRVEGWVTDVCNLTGNLTEVWGGEWELDAEYSVTLNGTNISWNASKLAHDLVTVRDMLDVSGISDWIRGMGVNGTWDPIHWAMTTFSEEDISHMLEQMWNHFQGMSDADMDAVATEADNWIWWLTHFIRSGGYTAQLLGETTGDMNWSTTANHSPEAPSSLLTEPGAALWRGMWQMRNDTTSGESWSMDWEENEEYHGEEHNESSHNTSIINDLIWLLDRLEGKTAYEIEQELLIEWEVDWKQECNAANHSEIVDKAIKTHMGCPFYRDVIEKLAEENITAWVQDIHRQMQEFNTTWWTEQLNHYQEMLNEIDADGVADSLENVIDNAQTLWAVSPNATTTEVATHMWEVVKDEAEDWMGIDLSCNSGDGDSGGWYRRLKGGKASRRRLQEDDGDFGDMTQDYILQQVLNRKILIAPYQGESKRMIDLLFVEGTLSVLGAPKGTGFEHLEGGIGGFLQAASRCPLVRTIVAKLVDMFLGDRLLTFSNEAELEEYAMSNADDVLMALVFRSADPVTGDFRVNSGGGVEVEYAIRMHAQLLPGTRKVLKGGSGSMFGEPSISSYPYLLVGFSYLQEFMGRATARLRASREGTLNSTLTDVGVNMFAHDRTHEGRQLTVSLEQFPAPQYEEDAFIYVIQYTIPLVMVLGWIYPVALLVKEIVYEKQERLRDVMRIMGLKTWVYWASWMSSAMIQMFVLVTIMTSILMSSQVLKHSDGSLLFLFFLGYSASATAMSLLISSFFSSAKVAAACGGLIYYVAYCPYNLYPRFEEVLSYHGKNMMCFLSPTGIGIGMNIFAKWELSEIGAKWSNLWDTPPVTTSGFAPQHDYGLGDVIMMFFIDTIVYLTLAWYVDKVKPGNLGLPQPWYFPVLPSYWFPKVPQLDGNVKEGEGDRDDSLETFEAAPSGLEVTVAIRKLSKTFPNGKQALKGITLDMHQGTIVGLLGHNGAGKSTTMAILTGLYPASSGDVTVNGVSVHQDSLGVRRQLGVCPQHNALWESMTVLEHMRLFCTLKAVPWHQVKAEAERLIADTGLAPKRLFPSRALSGGMKRKLSIGIALAGGSKVVTLDEPTAGVDASSRREIWQVLAAYKADRTILLSTHFMDEADILSDRIAIIAEGKLTAIGSSMALKRKYADGYMLVLVAADGANPSRLLQAVRNSVPEAKCVGSRGREYSFLLPFSAREKFPDLFTRLQSTENRETLGIDSYGLSAPTMEEVFLRASSVHEVGLHGSIRNTLDDAASEGGNSSEGSTRASTASGGKPPPLALPQDGENTPPDLTARESTGDSGDRTRPGTASSATGDEQAGGTGSWSPSRTPSNPGSGAGEGPTRQETPETSADARQTTPSGGDEAPQSPQCMVSKSNPEVDAKRDKIKTDVEKAAAPAANPKAGETMQRESPTLLSGPPLKAQQFYALMVKRALAVRRDRKAWASQLVLPALFVAVALVIAKILEIKDDMPPILLDTSMFVGTVSSGGKSRSLERHIIPSMYTEDSMASRVSSAFSAVGHDHNDFPGVDSFGTFETMSDYLLSQKDRSLTGSYASISSNCKADYAIMDGSNVTMWFQNQAYHIMPAMVNLWNNARFRVLGYEDSEVKAWSHPLPKTEAMLQEEMTGDSQIMTDLMVAITVILAMGFIPASFLVHVVHEKATNGKHQQLLSGIRPTMYWVANYVWDVINFLLPMFMCFFIFLAFGVEAYSGDNAGAIFFILLFYGACMTPFMYCFEPAFKVPSTAYVTLICTNIFTGTVSVMATTMLDMYQQDMPSLARVNDFLKGVLPFLLPNYCLGRGMIQIATNHYINYAVKEFGFCDMIPDDVDRPDCIVSPLSWDVSGRFIFMLVLMSPVWLSLRLLMEWGFCTRGLRKRALKLLGGPQQAAAGQDQAVDQEAERVASSLAQAWTGRDATGVMHSIFPSQGETQGDSLVISNLVKSFVTKRRGCRKRREIFHAVRGISVGVPSGECFGLLGVNGAGKTTTMRMITGDTEVGSGDVIVGGHSVHTSRDAARQHLGYCPQFDALPCKLTVRETLTMYARIRGIPRDQVKMTVNKLIKRMCLEAHQYQLCEYLSGGNKRKLSTALALVGEPDVVLLDEPSTGVDVGARRFLWEVISGIRKSGHAIVLTSHSMEECEVLCTRLTIMSHGRFRCLGSPIQLKAKYGGGYTLTVKAQQHDQDADAIREYCNSQLPGAVLAEESLGLFRYRIGATLEFMKQGEAMEQGAEEADVQLGAVFHKLEEAMAEAGPLAGRVSDYTMSQTSLEEVFLHFSRESEQITEAQRKA